MKTIQTLSNRFFKLHYLDLKSKMQAAISAGKQVYPDKQEQQKIIARVSAALCAWRVKVDMSTYAVEPVFEGDQCFPFSQVIDIETLLSYIHVDYLVPYLLCAEFTYTFINELKLQPRELTDYAFQISVPVKFPGDQDYYWYTQVSNLVVVNEFNITIEHTSIYYYEKAFNLFEYRLIQPSVIKNGRLFLSLHEGLLQKLRQHINTSLTAHEKSVVILYAKGYKLKAVAGEMDTAEGTERARNNTILKKTKEIIGFKFGTIAELADFFKKNKIIAPI